MIIYKGAVLLPGEGLPYDINTVPSLLEFTWRKLDSRGLSDADGSFFPRALCPLCLIGPLDGFVRWLQLEEGERAARRAAAKNAEKIRRKARDPNPIGQWYTFDT